MKYDNSSSNPVELYYHPHWYKQTPWRLSLAFLVLFCLVAPPATCQVARTGLTLGVSSTNWTTQTATGLAYQFNDNFAALGSLDLGGGSSAAQAQVAVLFGINSRAKIGFLVGPEVNVFQESPTFHDKLAYLNAATAILYWHDVTDRTTFLALAEYIATEAPTPKLRLSIRIAFWMGD